MGKFFQGSKNKDKTKKKKKKVKDCNETENVHKKWLVKFHLDKYKVMYRK